jgi:hypothetical protein
MANVTIEQLNAEYERLAAAFGKRSSDGSTVREIARETGWTESKIREVIRRGLEAGTVRLTSKPVAQINGAIRPMPSYVFTKPTKQRGAKAKR